MVATPFWPVRACQGQELWIYAQLACSMHNWVWRTIGMQYARGGKWASIATLNCSIKKPTVETLLLATHRHTPPPPPFPNNQSVSNCIAFYDCAACKALTVITCEYVHIPLTVITCEYIHIPLTVITYEYVHIPLTSSRVNTSTYHSRSSRVNTSTYYSRSSHLNTSTYHSRSSYVNTSTYHSRSSRVSTSTYSHLMTVSALHLCTVVECNAVRNTLVGGGGALAVYCQ